MMSPREQASSTALRANGGSFSLVSVAAWTALGGTLCAFVASACGSSSDTADSGTVDASTGDGDRGLSGDSSNGPVGTFGDAGAHFDGGAFSDVFVLPANFVSTEKGGYALGAPLTGGGSDAGVVQNGNASCALVVGVVRDFLSYQLQPNGHADFEHFQGDGPTLGLVQPMIAADRKPVYNGECDNNSNGGPNPPCLYGQQMTTNSNFDEWYRYNANVNAPFVVYLQFVPNGGVYTFQSSSFFPLDNAGFGNTPGFGHNFSFTTEVHLKFTYKGGETFSFTGDDDLWVFINGKLAIDLGGLHSPASAAVSLDTLGLAKGTEYDIELFNAERHSTGSNFRVDTNLAFTNCGTLPPDIPK